MRTVVYFLAGILTSVLVLVSFNQLHADTFVAKPPTLKSGDPMPANLFVELAKAINPAVVNISTSVIPRYVRDPFWDQLEQMYGIRGGGQGQARGDNKPVPYSLGTGFVIREDGLIVTNAHVIKNADLVTVQFTENSDQSFEAKIIGSDERADIALLKIQPKGKIAVAALGSSADVQVGEWVAAFGNPFGHGHTMTKGIISASARTLEEINKFPLLQTDAAINPGNSGGPLVDSKGYVIGVNSAMDARAQGISFAIPIDEVKRILPELEKNGHLRKGYLGVGLADIVSYADEQPAGAAIVNVPAGGPADKAGLRYGDVIVEINGHKMHNSVEVTDAIAETTPGNKIELTVLRQIGAAEKTIKVNAIVGDFPNRLPRMQPRKQVGTIAQQAPYNFGFSMEDLTPELRAQYDLPGDLKKPIVVSVDENSSASFVGLVPGDVILEVNRTEVKTAKEVVSKMKAGTNTLKIGRGNKIIITSISK